MLVTREMLKLMKPSAVVVDVAIDQGGVFETSRPTTHEHPVYIEEGIVHYCVSNMPGAVAGTSTYALTNATGRYILSLANKGWKKALSDDATLRKGLNIAQGKVVLRAVAEMFGYEAAPVDEVLASNIQGLCPRTLPPNLTGRVSGYTMLLIHLEETLRILGFEPGTATTGYGVVDKVGSSPVMVDYGAILTSPKETAPERLLDVHTQLNAIIDKYRPDVIVMETAVFCQKQTTAIAVGESCGVMQLAAAQRGLAVIEYTPMEVKQAVVGYGGAEKKQVR